MKILFIGDVFGRSGREALAAHLPLLKRENNPDVIIVNGENAASGAGITDKIARDFFSLGVDVITTGNHVWDKREVVPYIANEPRLLRPINYPPNTAGKGIIRYQTRGGQTVVVINAMARLFMESLDCPFRTVSEAIAGERMGQTSQAIFIDFHGEATSEKMSFAHYFDGKVSAVIGTHTHIPTADAHVMAGGTGYQSDAGMTGDYNSVIGMDKSIAVARFVKKVPGEKNKPALGTGTLCGVLVETNDNTGLAKKLHPIRMGPLLDNVRPAS
jgi:hypothetical protein